MACGGIDQRNLYRSGTELEIAEAAGAPALMRGADESPARSYTVGLRGFLDNLTARTGVATARVAARALPPTLCAKPDQKAIDLIVQCFLAPFLAEHPTLYLSEFANFSMWEFMRLLMAEALGEKALQLSGRDLSQKDLNHSSMQLLAQMEILCDPTPERFHSASYLSMMKSLSGETPPTRRDKFISSLINRPGWEQLRIEDFLTSTKFIPPAAMSTPISPSEFVRVTERSCQTNMRLLIGPLFNCVQEVIQDINSFLSIDDQSLTALQSRDRRSAARPRHAEGLKTQAFQIFVKGLCNRTKKIALLQSSITEGLEQERQSNFSILLGTLDELSKRLLLTLAAGYGIILPEQLWTKDYLVQFNIRNQSIILESVITFHDLLQNIINSAPELSSQERKELFTELQELIQMGFSNAPSRRGKDKKHSLINAEMRIAITAYCKKSLERSIQLHIENARTVSVSTAMLFTGALEETEANARTQFVAAFSGIFKELVSTLPQVRVGNQELLKHVQTHYNQVISDTEASIRNKRDPNLDITPLIEMIKRTMRSRSNPVGHEELPEILIQKSEREFTELAETLSLLRQVIPHIERVAQDLSLAPACLLTAENREAEEAAYLQQLEELDWSEEERASPKRRELTAEDRQLLDACRRPLPARVSHEPAARSQEGAGVTALEPEDYLQSLLGSILPPSLQMKIERGEDLAAPLAARVHTGIYCTEICALFQATDSRTVKAFAMPLVNALHLFLEQAATDLESSREDARNSHRLADRLASAGFPAELCEKASKLNNLGTFSARYPATTERYVRNLATQFLQAVEASDTGQAMVLLNRLVNETFALYAKMEHHLHPSDIAIDSLPEVTKLLQVDADKMHLIADGSSRKKPLESFPPLLSTIERVKEHTQQLLEHCPQRRTREYLTNALRLLTELHASITFLTTMHSIPRPLFGALVHQYMRAVQYTVKNILNAHLLSLEETPIKTNDLESLLEQCLYDDRPNYERVVAWIQEINMDKKLDYPLSTSRCSESASNRVTLLTTAHTISQIPEGFETTSLTPQKIELTERQFLQSLRRDLQGLEQLQQLLNPQEE